MTIKRSILFSILFWLPMVFLYFGGIIGFAYMLMIIGASTYYAYCTFKQKKYVSLSVFALSACLSGFVAFTPHSHISIPPYIEVNGERVPNYHSHWLWEYGHIH